MIVLKAMIKRNFDLIRYINHLKANADIYFLFIVSY